MGLSSLALFHFLAEDLGSTLNTVPGDQLFERRAKRSPWPGIRVDQVAALNLLNSIFKKFEDEKDAKADAAALDKFLESNAICENFQSIDVSNMSEIEALCLGETRSEVYSFFELPGQDRYILDTNLISEGINVGPGASVGVTGESFYHKVASSALTGTSRTLFSLYNREAEKYPLWLETEKIRSSHFGNFTPVKGSRLSFVPKSSEISRTICTEPLLNMMFQKGIAACFERQLDRRFGIDLKSQQPKNQALAKIGSEEGTFGTIDLSSASDSISLNLVRELLPRSIYLWLMETRTSETLLPDGRSIPLHMVSSMGNAFTFPLQTILFCSIVRGVYRALGIKLILPRTTSSFDYYGNFAVFGDDIIVLREAYDLVCSLLRRFGFRVNADKSFNQGLFRESCGADFWQGHNVRGIYCQSLKTKQDLYSLINRLNVWSANHGILLTRTISYLMSDRLEFMPVPPWENDDAGIKVPQNCIPEFKLWRHRHMGSIVYKRYLAKSRKVSLLDVGSRPVEKRRSVIHNPPGILLSAIGGYLRNGYLMQRLQNVHYQKRLGIAPCWDYIDLCHSKFTSDGWRRWLKIYAALNLEVV